MVVVVLLLVARGIIVQGVGAVAASAALVFVI